MPLKNNPGSPKPESSGLLPRRDAIRIGVVGILGLSLVSDVSPPNDEKLSETLRLSHKEEMLSEALELKLGHFTFIVPPNELSRHEAESLLNNIEDAYFKLESYFGTDVLMMNYPQRITLKNSELSEMILGGAEQHAVIEEVVNDWARVSISQNRFFGVKDVNDKTTLLHELFHLCVQWNMPIDSSAFTEGHARVIQDFFYPEDAEKVKEFDISPELPDLINEGQWDIYGNLSGTLIKTSDAHTSNLYWLLQEKWKRDWQELLKKDPDFLKNFYRKIGEYKKRKDIKGLSDYTALFDIGDEVSPVFKEWVLTQGRSMRIPFIGEKSRIVLVKKMKSGNSVHIVNIGTRNEQPEIDEKGELKYYTYGSSQVKIHTRYKDMDGLFIIDFDGPHMNIFDEIPNGEIPVMFEFDGIVLPILEEGKSLLESK